MNLRVKNKILNSILQQIYKNKNKKLSMFVWDLFTFNIIP